MEALRELMWMACELSGYPVAVEEDPYMPLDGRMEHAAVTGRDHHLIRYNPNCGKPKEHIVAHECAHIIRLGRSEPRMMGFTEESIGKAVEDIMRDEGRLDKGTCLSMAVDLLTQLYNTPQDIRIERWLYERFPTLRGMQSESLRRTVEEYQMILSREVERFTPRKVYRASCGMNSAFTRGVVPILKDKRILRPYYGRVGDAIGKRLIRILEGVPDNGYEGDIEVIDMWAQELGVRDWYVWKVIGD